MVSDRRFDRSPTQTKANQSSSCKGNFHKLKTDGRPLYAEFVGFLIARGGLEGSEVSKVLGSLAVVPKSSQVLELD